MFSELFSRRQLLVIYAFVVFILAFFSFFWNYNYPNSSQWDEVYHISSAEKYLKGSLFMESHPPLGKMFIALGEKILGPNAAKPDVSFLGKLCFGQEDWKIRPEIIDKSSFLKVDQITSYPTGFSFCGFRLMPVVFATLTAPLLFFLLFLLIRNVHLAAIFSSLYLFDNAIILQARAAMVDSIQIFFVILALVYFVFGIEKVTGNLPWELRQFWAKNENLESQQILNSKTMSKKLSTNSQSKKLSQNLLNLTWQNYFILGLFCSLSIATKHNAAIILVLPIAWFIFELWTNRINLYLEFLYKKFTREVWIGTGVLLFSTCILVFSYYFISNAEDFNSFRDIYTKFLLFLIVVLPVITLIFCFIRFRTNPIFKNWLENLIKIGSFSLGLLLMYTSVFAIHVSIGSAVIPDNNNRNGFYLTSDQYKEILKENGTRNPINWPIMIFDNWQYMQQYHGGVPKLDLCKRDDAGNLSENGSYPITWPVMNRTISFRWEWGTKDGSVAKDSTYIRYSYLIGNPLIWSIGLASIILALVLVLGFLCFNLPLKNRRVFNYILTLTALYLAYMIGVLSVERVMYLYHYLIPLIFSLILAPLLFVYVFGNLEENSEENNKFALVDLENSKPNSDTGFDFNSQQNLEPKLKEKFTENLADFPKTELRKSRILEHKNLESEGVLEAELKNEKNLEKNDELKNSQNSKTQISKNNSKYPQYFWYWIVLYCGFLLIFACFAFFSPFTYYQPLSRSDFMMRNWFSFWQMRIVN